jgi:predicted MFS family arabinose efflux permease
VLLYPVYALLFADTGLSTAEISSLFVIWSVTSFTLEVPSGVWADVVSRRRLLVLAPLLSGTGFALWVLAPSYPAFAVGFVLWGAQGALQSGALEALVYEELERHDAADRYASVVGRATAVGTAAGAAAMAVAAPVFAAGGYAAVGAASVLACLAAAATALGFPEHRVRTEADTGGLRAYASVLRSGIGELRASPAVRRTLLLVPAVTVVWGALDEYLPLLAIETGVGAETVPLLALLVYAGMTAGGALAGRADRLSGRGLGALLVVAAAALAAGALSRSPWGFVLVAAAFGLLQAATVAVDARLQAAIDGGARSTITSVASLITELCVVGLFVAYAAGSTLAGHATLFAACAATYLLTAVLTARIAHPRAAGSAATRSA